MIHPFRFFRLNWIINIVSTVVIALTLCFTNNIYYRASESEAFLNASNYESAGFLNSFSSDENTYYSSIYGIEATINNKYVSSDVFMSKESIKYGGNYFTQYNHIEIEDKKLTSQECSISKTLAKKYHLKPGNSVDIYSNFVHYNFSVKYIFDGYTGSMFSNVLETKYLIILGENIDLRDNMISSQIIHFSSQKDYHYSSGIEPILKEHDVNRVRGIRYSIVGSISLLFTITFLIIELLFSSRSRNDLYDGIYSSDSKKTIMASQLLDSTYKWLDVYLIPFIGVLLVQLFSNTFMLFYLLLIALSFLLSTLLSFILRRYETWRVLR